MRRALIVGIDAYPTSPLTGCVNDATAIANILTKHQDRSPNFECKKLLAPNQNITRPILKQHIEELFSHQADVALFYFSGHGTENNLGGFLVTPDAKQYDEGVPMSDLLTAANQSPAKEVLIIVDCCHSGALGQLPAISNEYANIREGISILTATRST